MISTCEYCKYGGRRLRSMRLVTELPLTDDKGVPLTGPPTVHYCEECIQGIAKEPTLFRLEEVAAS